MIGDADELEPRANPLRREWNEADRILLKVYIRLRLKRLEGSGAYQFKEKKRNIVRAARAIILYKKYGKTLRHIQNRLEWNACADLLRRYGGISPHWLLAQKPDPPRYKLLRFIYDPEIHREAKKKLPCRCVGLKNAWEYLGSVSRERVNKNTKSIVTTRKYRRRHCWVCGEAISEVRA